MLYENLIYIKRMVVSEIIFSDMVAVMGLSRMGNCFFIMPIKNFLKDDLSLHNSNREVCDLIPSLNLGRYCTNADICNSTEKNYIILKNIHDILQVNL